MSFLLSSARFGGPPTTLLNFAANAYTTPGGSASTVATIPNISVARASVGFAETLAGVLVPFAANVARVTDKGLLPEKAGTNIFPRSQELSDAAWLKTGCTVTADTVTAPDGTTTADTVNEGAGWSYHSPYRGAQSLVAGETYALSVYAKNNTGTYVGLFAYTGPTVFAGATFNLATGAVAASLASGAGWTIVSASITALADGWYRCTLVFVSGTTSGAAAVGYTMSDDGTIAANQYGTKTYSGTSRSIYLWGAQYEQAASPSSYIATVASSATRAADVISIGSLSYSYPASMVVTYERRRDSGLTEILAQLDAGSENDVSLISVGTSDKAAAAMTAGGVAQGSSVSAASVAAGSTAKIAARFGANTIRAALGGTLAAEDTTATTPATATTLRIGSNSVGANQPAGYISRIAIYTRGLPNVEMETEST